MVRSEYRSGSNTGAVAVIKQKRLTVVTHDPFQVGVQRHSRYLEEVNTRLLSSGWRGWSGMVSLTPRDDEKEKKRKTQSKRKSRGNDKKSARCVGIIGVRWKMASSEVDVLSRGEEPPFVVRGGKQSHLGRGGGDGHGSLAHKR